MALHSLRQILGGAHIITSVFETLQDIDEIGHGRKKACHLDVMTSLVSTSGGDDGTRTLDLPVTVDGTF